MTKPRNGEGELAQEREVRRGLRGGCEERRRVRGVHGHDRESALRPSSQAEHRGLSVTGRCRPNLYRSREGPPTTSWAVEGQPFPRCVRDGFQKFQIRVGRPMAEQIPDDRGDLAGGRRRPIQIGQTVGRRLCRGFRGHFQPRRLFLLTSRSSSAVDLGGGTLLLQLDKQRFGLGDPGGRQTLEQDLLHSGSFSLGPLAENHA